MPQLGNYEYLLDSVFYLYKNEEDARNGVNSGGTGFIVSMRSEKFPHYNYCRTIYGVTNWHVVTSKDYPVVRINKHQGSPAVFPFDPADWEHIPNFHDISVIPLELNEDHKAADVSINLFITKENIQRQKINVGDDLFMLGRFLDYDGIETNKPAMRFGNISIFGAAIKQDTGYCGGDSIVADMHSRDEFSGSPVFVFRRRWCINPL